MATTEISTSQFDNSYARLPEGFHQPGEPARVPEPSLLAFNSELAAQLGLEDFAEDPARAARIFSGNEILPGSQPLSMAYAGHQFGQFSPQLGDGRALLLGEVIDAQGHRFDVQLKGSGRTVFSRGGDGKSWLGPVIREYLLSEAMARLGVPTTRALAAVTTGEPVFRNGASLPGGVFTRVASSHLRVGTFEFFAARRDTEALKTLADYAINRHYPEAREADSPITAFFRAVCEKQATLVASWMSVGFIHGVMNTDNTSIAGETIDYGPAAYMDEFRFNKVFSSIDHQGRYAYGNQAPIAQWNLARLAETLLAIDADRAELEDALKQFGERYESEFLRLMRPKLGLLEPDESDKDLIVDWLTHLQDEELDFTMSFRELSKQLAPDAVPVHGPFEERWKKRVLSQSSTPEKMAAAMNGVNPLFIPRNHRVEQAIEEAVEGRFDTFKELSIVLAEPFNEHEGLSHYAVPPEPAERVTQTFCGT